jgi:hypothetical protein
LIISGEINHPFSNFLFMNINFLIYLFIQQ